MVRATKVQHWALVLAGGDGTRLKELTREIVGTPIPKQYCRLLGEQSLLEATLDRTKHFAGRERTLVIVNRNHLDVAREQLRGLPPRNVLVQPCNRDTGPGLLFALVHLQRRNANALVAVFPSDHYVDDGRAFIAHVKRAVGIVTEQTEKVAVLGIRPDRVEPGYGHILPARSISTHEDAGPAFAVAAFREKPSLEVAHRLFLEGGLWNSFVMVFHVGRMLDLLRWAAPRESERMWQFSSDPGGLATLYGDITAWNFSSQVLARIPEHLIVLPVDDVHWSDWGTRESIEHTLRILNQPPPWLPRQPATAAA
jgi:mannose-1-phosphate guanylyltransferase